MLLVSWLSRDSLRTVLCECGRNRSTHDQAEQMHRVYASIVLLRGHSASCTLDFNEYTSFYTFLYGTHTNLEIGNTSKCRKVKNTSPIAGALISHMGWIHLSTTSRQNVCYPSVKLKLLCVVRCSNVYTPATASNCFWYLSRMSHRRKWVA